MNEKKDYGDTNVATQTPEISAQKEPLKIRSTDELVSSFHLEVIRQAVSASRASLVGAVIAHTRGTIVNIVGSRAEKDYEGDRLLFKLVRKSA